jgi:hypothetical protein
MHKNVIDIVDIISIKEKGNNIFECTNSIKFIDNINNYKKISESTYQVYVYNNLYLLVDLNNNNKKCELVENYENKIIKNMIIIKSLIKEVDMTCFPFIDKYHDIIVRHVTSYQNGVSIMKEISNETKESVTFIRINNKEIDIDKLINV